MKTSSILNSKMMLAIAFCMSISSFASAQMSKFWDYRFGGTAIDEFHDLLSIIDTNNFDGKGYLLAGYSESGINGDKTVASQGSGDFWLINLNSNGVKQWDKSYGGSAYDELFEVQQTSDGGFILGGWSNSGISGDKSQANIGAGDYWVVRTDMHGTKLWDKTFGGTSEDYLQSIKQTSDGGYILAGRSNSGISGNKTQANRGVVGVNWDYWIVKISSNGTFQWDQTFGGADDDWLFSIQQTSDGGYILGGYSNSGITGDKSQASKGFDDYWIVKTDANGVKQWDKTFGGSNPDQMQVVKQTSDGGYILGGSSASGANGDKSQATRGNFDYWILKTDASGAKQWDKRFGGSSADNLFDLIQTSDGGYLLGGASSSAANGDKTQGNQGTVGTSNDFWIVKTDASGIAQVDRRFGGSSDDYSKSIIETSDGNYALAGWSTSGANGDKTQASQGSIDYWVLKVSGPNSVTTSPIAGPLCAGTNINVGFTATGTFNAGNIFTAQLSDSSGSFASPTDIGTLSSTSSGNISATLPFTFASSHYKIQVVSNNPVSQDIYPSSFIQIDYPQTYFDDVDQDGYGSAVTAPTLSCTPVVGKVTNNNDCNDNDGAVHQLPAEPTGIYAQSSNCEGSSGNIFNTNPVFQATSYQWILPSGFSSSFVNNITPDTLISVSIALGIDSGIIGVVGKNSCGISDTVFYHALVSQLPDAAGAISGTTLVSSCTNQNGIVYQVAPIANASSYVWSLPDSAEIVGNSDTNSIVVNYSPYGVSGTISVYATNICGVGTSSSLPITFESIPQVDLCYITVDSATQKSLLWWQKPVAGQSDSIVIMRKNKSSGLFEKIATVKDTVPTSYLDLTSDPGNIAGETYKMAIKDTCSNVGSFSTATTHKTIYLYGYLGWSNFPKLYWTPYEGINDTTRYYRILRDVTGNGPFSALDSVNYNGSLNYTDISPLAPNCSTCRYRIEMVYTSNCTPTEKIMLSKNTTQSNIKNKIAMNFDSTLLYNQNLNDYELKITIAPNPTNGNCVLKNSSNLKDVSLTLYSILGEVVWEQKINELAAKNEVLVPLSEYTEGTYFLKIRSQERVVVKKLIRK